MVPEQLLSYVKENMRAGFRKADIETALRTSGWSAEDITAAFVAADASAAPTAPVSTPRTLEPNAAQPAHVLANFGVAQNKPQTEKQTGATGVAGWLIQKGMVATPEQANAVMLMLTVSFLGLAAWIAFH